jgi:serine/threonine-protein kinase
LKEAHGRGLIHRDIKPSNIMLCERGGVYDVVKVLDFGLVKESRQEKPELTQPNTIVGTPFYLAPELIIDASTFSPQSDLYALSGVAYYLLTGRNVFEGTSSVEICAMHLHDEPVPPSQITTRKISTDLETIVMACLAKEPADRPQGAGVMSEMIAQCRDYGAWTQDQAQKWWADNGSALPMEGHEDSRSPLADTHLFIDAGDRTRT